MSKARETVETLRTVLVDGDIGTDVLAPDGSAANLTNLPASGAADFVASGTLPNGKPVILKANGQVEVVGMSPPTQIIPAGSETTFNAGSSYYNAVAFDKNTEGKFVVAYKDNDNSNYGTACVGQISGTSISFGAETVFASVSADWISIASDPNTANKFVITYTDSQGKAVVATVSGTSISFGTTYVFNGSNSSQMTESMAFDPNTANKFVVCYKDAGNANRGNAVVGTVSGTSISFGSESTFNTANTANISMSFDPNTANKFVVGYLDAGNSEYGTSVIGTLSGTSISFGSEVVFNSGPSQYVKVAYDPDTANKFVAVYKDENNSHYGTAILGTVSGTSISFGNEAVFNSGVTNYTSISFDHNTSGKFLVSYQDATNSGYGTVSVGQISGTSISFGSKSVINAGSTTYISMSFDSNSSIGNFVVAYRDGPTSPAGFGNIRLGQTEGSVTNLTSTNFLGTATAAYTNGQTASIMLKGGISDNQTSLTAGSTYYVQPAGTFATSAGTPSVLAGEAVSATSLLLNGLATPNEIPSQTSQSGKFLTTNGSAASWGTVAPAGLVLLSTVTASSSSTVDIETTFDGTYDSYVIMATNVKPASNNQNLKCRFKISGSYRTANYYLHRNKSNSSSSGYVGVSASNDGDLVIASGLASSNNHHLNFNLYISQPTITNKFHTVHWNGSHIDGNQYSVEASGVAYNQNTGALTGIRFECASGTVEIGTFKLYGVAK